MTLNTYEHIIPQYSLNIQMHILLKNLKYTNFSIKFVHSKKVGHKKFEASNVNEHRIIVKY